MTKALNELKQGILDMDNATVAAPLFAKLEGVEADIEAQEERLREAVQLLQRWNLYRKHIHGYVRKDCSCDNCTGLLGTSERWTEREPSCKGGKGEDNDG